MNIATPSFNEERKELERQESEAIAKCDCTLRSNALTKRDSST